MLKMIDYAEIIKSSVPMHDAVERYTGQRIVLNRICCPIHHGRDRNMRIYQRSFHCFVCHATGDVIQFVMGVLGLPFRDAMQRLNEDFNIGLPIGTERTDLNRPDLNRINREIARRKWQESLAQIDADIYGRHVADLAGLLHTVSVIIETERPKTADEEWNPVWCMAMRVMELLNEQIR